MFLSKSRGLTLQYSAWLHSVPLLLFPYAYVFIEDIVLPMARASALSPALLRQVTDEEYNYPRCYLGSQSAS